MGNMRWIAMVGLTAFAGVACAWNAGGDDDPCAELECGAGQVCEMREVQCVTAPCPAQPVCVDDVEPPALGEACGGVTCAADRVCCNASCGICTAPGEFCTQQACQPVAGTCDEVECGPGEGCIETPRGPRCVVAGTCANVLCEVGSACVETPSGPTCEPAEPQSCETVDCGANSYCDDISGVAECLPLPSCATVRCTTGTVCELQNVQCVRAPCPPQPVCVPEPDAGKTCGNVTCSAGQECCNASCGICVEPGGACTQQFCEPQMGTCAEVDCRAGTTCIETPGGPMCQPTLTCASVLCVVGTTCVETPSGPSCEPNQGGASCATVRCAKDTYCDDISGVAECLPLPSCATVRCETGFSCELQDVQCIRAPCPPQPVCVAD